MPLDFNPSYQTADERLAEAARILRLCAEDHVADYCSTAEHIFLTDMVDAKSCSPAQLNWLRRIKEKYQ